jgi:hypothetical protein
VRQGARGAAGRGRVRQGFGMCVFILSLPPNTGPWVFWVMLATRRYILGHSRKLQAAGRLVLYTTAPLATARSGVRHCAAGGGWQGAAGRGRVRQRQGAACVRLGAARRGSVRSGATRRCGRVWRGAEGHVGTCVCVCVCVCVGACGRAWASVGVRGRVWVGSVSVCARVRVWVCARCAGVCGCVGVCVSVWA